MQVMHKIYSLVYVCKVTNCLTAVHHRTFSLTFYQTLSGPNVIKKDKRIKVIYLDFKCDLLKSFLCNKKRYFIFNKSLFTLV